MLCIALPHFAAAVETKRQPDLADKPLILTQKRKRGHVVTAVNARAWAYGVRPFEPLHQAKIRCEDAEIRPANPLAYERMLYQIADRLYPLVTKLEPDYQPTVASIYVDVSYKPETLAHIGQIIQEMVGIRTQFGRSEKKFAARVAAAIAGEGKCAIVIPGDEAHFLAPYRVSMLPLPIQMARKLELIGITTLGELAKLPRIEVWQQFGREGRRMHEWASGEDIRPIAAYTPEPVIEIQRRFEDGLSEWPRLQRHLQQMGQDLLKQLDGKAAHKLWLNVEHTDKSTWDELRQPTDPIRSNNPFFLQRQLRYVFEQHPIHAPIESITLGLSQLKDPLPVQLSLFDEPTKSKQLPNLIPLWLERQPQLTLCQIDLHHPDHLVADERFSIQHLSLQHLSGA